MSLHQRPAEEATLMDLEFPSETMAVETHLGGNDCEHCASQLQFQSILRSYGRKGLAADELRKLFHQSCITCSNFELDDETLCSFCRHLRFRHMALCAVTHYSVSFCPLREHMMKNGEPLKCLLCRVLRSTMLKSCESMDVFDPSKGAYEIVLGLAKCQSPVRSRLASF